MFEEEEEDSGMSAVRYACMPSLVSLQLMRNRLHLAYLGRKLMKWSALATGRELRKIAMQLDLVYDSFAEDMRNAYMLLARGRYFCPIMNKMVIENVAEKASVTAKSTLRMVTGVKIPQYEIVESGVEPYEHLGIEKGGQQIHEAKVAWLELLKRLVLIVQLRVSFTLVELANKSATKRKNVLSKTVTPRIIATLMYIMSELEEQAREETFRLKRVKQKKSKKSDNDKENPRDPECTCKMLDIDDKCITEVIYPKGQDNLIQNVSEASMASKHFDKSQASDDFEDKKQLDYLLSHVEEIVQNLKKQKQMSKSMEKLIETCNKFKGTIQNFTSTVPSQCSHTFQPQLCRASSSSIKTVGTGKHSCNRITTPQTERDLKHICGQRSKGSEYHKRCVAPEELNKKKYLIVPQSKTNEYLKVYSQSHINKETSCVCEKMKTTDDQICPVCGEKPREADQDRIESAPQSKSEGYIDKDLSFGSKEDLCSVCGKTTESCLTSDIQERIQYMSAPQSKSEEYIKKHLSHQSKSTENKEALCSNCGTKAENKIAPELQERIQYMSAPQSKSEENIKIHLLNQNKSAGSEETLCSNCAKKGNTTISPEVQKRIEYMSAPQSESEECIKNHLSRQNKSKKYKEMLCSNCGKQAENTTTSKIQERIQYMSAPQSKSEENIKKHLLNQNKSAGSVETLCSNCAKKGKTSISPEVQKRIEYMSAPQSESEECIKNHLSHQNKSKKYKEMLCSNCGKKAENTTTSEIQERIQYMSAPQSKSEENIKKHLLNQNKSAGSDETLCSNCAKRGKTLISPEVQKRIEYMSAPQSKSEENIRMHLLNQNKFTDRKEELCSNCSKRIKSEILPDVQERIEYMSAPQSESEEYIKNHLSRQNKSAKYTESLCSNCVKNSTSSDLQDRIRYMSAPESDSQEYIKKHCSNQNKSTGNKEGLCTVCASETEKRNELTALSKKELCSKPSLSSSQKNICCKVASKEKQKVSSKLHASFAEKTNLDSTKDKINTKEENQPLKLDNTKSAPGEMCLKCFNEGKVDIIKMERTSSSEYHKRCFSDKLQKDSHIWSKPIETKESCSICSSPLQRSGSTEAIWRDTWTSTTDLEVVPSKIPSKSTLKQSSKSKTEHSDSAIKIIVKPSSRHKSEKLSMGGVSASSECLTCNYSSKTKSLDESETNASLCRQCRNNSNSKTKRGASESSFCKRCQANYEKSFTKTSSNRCSRCKKDNIISRHTCPICQSGNSSVSDFQGGLSLGSEKSKCYLCGKETKDGTYQDIDSLGLKCSILSFIKSKLLSDPTDEEIPCPRCNARKAAERCQTACFLCKKRISEINKSSEESNKKSSCTFSSKSRAADIDPGKYCATSNSLTYATDGDEVCCGTQTVAKHSCKFDDNVQIACIPDPDKMGEVKEPSPQLDCVANTREFGVNTKTADRYDVRPVHLLSNNTSQSSCSCKPKASLNMCRCKSSPTCNSRRKSLRNVRSYDL